VNDVLCVQAEQHHDQPRQYEQADTERPIGTPDGGYAGPPGGGLRRPGHGGTSFPPEYSLTRDLALAADPVLLARQVGLEPDAWQAAALHSTAPRAIWNVTRQGGKRSVATVLAIHQALYTPGSLTLLVSASLRQSAELFRALVAAVDLAPEYVTCDFGRVRQEVRDVREQRIGAQHHLPGQRALAHLALGHGQQHGVR
jgi:hypothetical protein